MIDENDSNEKKQHGNLDSKPVTDTTNIPAIVPPDKNVIPPQNHASEPTTQSTRDTPTQPPQQRLPRGPETPEAPDYSNESRNISQDTLKATQGMVRATYWGIFFGALTAAVFLAQLKTMTDQTQILASQAITDVANAVSADRYAQKQIAALQSQVTAVQRQMRQDQRAWITVNVGSNDGIPENQPIIVLTSRSVPVTLVNTGKTPALRFVAVAILEIVKNGQSPSLKYRNRIAARQSSGAVFTNDPSTLKAQTVSEIPNTGKGEPRNISGREIIDLRAGTTYVAVYGRVEYRDIFNTPHWVHFCSFGNYSNKPAIGAQKCTNYNNVDNN